MVRTEKVEEQEFYTKEFLEEFLCDDKVINDLRKTLSNAEWRRIIKTKIL